MQGQTDWKQSSKIKRTAGRRGLWKALLILSGCLMLGLGLICSEIGWGELPTIPILFRAVLIDGAVLVVSLLFFLRSGGRDRTGDRGGMGSPHPLPLDPQSAWDSRILAMQSQGRQRAAKLYRVSVVLLVIVLILAAYLVVLLRRPDSKAVLESGLNAYVPGTAVILSIVLVCCLRSARKKSRQGDGQPITTGVYREQLVLPCLREVFGEAAFLNGGLFSDTLIRRSGAMGQLDYCNAYGLLELRDRGVHITCADLVAGYEYTTTSEDDDGHRTTETHNKTVFDGRWFELLADRPLSAGLFCVWNKQFCKNRGKKAAAAQGLRPVTLGDGGFDRQFEIYAQDEGEARRFLNSAVTAGLERLLRTESGERSAHDVALICSGNAVQVLLSDLPAAFVPDRLLRNLTEAACRAKIHAEIAVITEVADCLAPALR